MQTIVLTKEELLDLYYTDLDTLLELSSKFMSNNIEFCSLVNARNGKCSQDCKYCAQSSHYRTNIETYPLIKHEQAYKAAKEAKENGANHFAVVTSGKTPEEENFDKIIELIKEIKKVDGLKSCASIGILNDKTAKRLADAGLDRFHHNINTSESYYPSVCTTHSWQDRVNTCRLAKKYGMELCCGVILGMGETVEQRIEMALELSEIEPDSIPINILMPIKDTPFESYFDKIDEENILRTLAIFKISNPKSVLRFCGGRMRLTEEGQELALKTCVEGILTGNYLTTTGKSADQDLKTIKKLGKNLLK